MKRFLHNPVRGEQIIKKTYPDELCIVAEQLAQVARRIGKRLTRTRES